MGQIVILVLLYKGTSQIVVLSDQDQAFLTSDQYKWGIILLAIVLVLGTMFDLYFSLAVRTLYLLRLYYPDLTGDEDTSKKPAAQKSARRSKRKKQYTDPLTNQTQMNMLAGPQKEENNVLVDYDEEAEKKAENKSKKKNRKSEAADE